MSVEPAATVTALAGQAEHDDAPGKLLYEPIAHTNAAKKASKKREIRDGTNHQRLRATCSALDCMEEVRTRAGAAGDAEEAGDAR